MSVAPAGVSNVLIAISGVLQDPATYGVVGNTLNFSAAPPTGTNNISCRYLGVPATGVTTTAYRTQTEFTATAGQTTFSVPSYTPGFIDVYRNGVLLSSTNFVATNGTTVVLNNAASEGDLIETVSFLVSSVLNAIPATAGSVGTSNIANGVTINFADGSASTPSITNDGDTNTGIFFPAADTIAFSEGGTEVARFDSAGNLGVGTTSPAAKLEVNGNIRLNGGGNTLYTTSADLVFQSGSSGLIRFFNNDGANERMRIDSNGQVGIGSNNPGNARLFVVSSDSLSSAWSILATNSSGATQLGLRNDNYLLAPSVANYPTTGTTVVLNGQYIGYLSSSIRFKKDVVNYDKGLAEVAQLRPVYYRGSKPNQDGEYDERTYAGFIAEEVKELGLEEYIDYDQEGEVVSLKYGQMTALLCKAIQEQQALITQLQADVAALKGATE
jgi:hypothetical protein